MDKDKLEWRGLTSLGVAINMQCINWGLTDIVDNKDGTITITVDCPHCDFSCGYAKRLAPRQKTFKFDTGEKTK